MLTHVALMNLLVAMFTDTYARVFAHSENEYGFTRYVSTNFYMHHALAIPPPVNMLPALWDLGLEVVPSRLLPAEFVRRRQVTRKLQTSLSEIDKPLSGGPLEHERTRREVAKASLVRQTRLEQGTLVGLSEKLSDNLPRQLQSMEERQDNKLTQLDLRVQEVRTLLESRVAGERREWMRASASAHSPKSPATRIEVGALTKQNDPMLDADHHLSC